MWNAEEVVEVFDTARHAYALSPGRAWPDGCGLVVDGRSQIALIQLRLAVLRGVANKSAAASGL